MLFGIPSAKFGHGGRIWDGFRFLWSVFLPLLPSQAWAGFAVVGPGVDTCQQFASHYKKKPTFSEDHYFSWAQGYMSGLNEVMLVGGEPGRDLSSLSTDRGTIRIRLFL